MRAILSGIMVAVCLSAAATAGADGLTLSGSVFAEGKVDAAMVRVWAAGERVVRDPALLDKPLAEAAVKPATAFSVALKDATLPLRLEVAAEGHVGVCLDVVFPQQAALPPAWLPAGERVEIAVTRLGKPAPAARVWGEIRSGALQEPRPDRWRPCLPRTEADAAGRVAAWVDPHAALQLRGRDGSGGWGASYAKPPLGAPPLALDSVPVEVAVKDRYGEPVAGMRVAATGAPVGCAARTDEHGRATVQARPEREWALLGLGDGIGVRSVQRGAPEGVVALAAAPVPELELSWSGPRGEVAAALPWLPDALTGGAPRLLAGGRASLPTVGLVPGPRFGNPQLAVWAPGFTPEWVVVGSTDPVAVALRPAVTVSASLTGDDGTPRPSVPVWAWEEPRERFFARRRTSPDELRRAPLPLGVTDGHGRATLAGLDPGWLRVTAEVPGFPRADSSPFEAAPGDTHPVALTLRKGSWLALAVADEGGAPIPGASVAVYPQRSGGRPLLLVFGAGMDDRLAQELLGQGVSDGDGRARVDGLPPGGVAVRVRAAGFVTRRLTGEVAPEGTDLGEVALAAGTDVVGRVVDTDGQPVPGAVVSVREGLSPFGRQVAESDSEGSFVVPDQPREGGIVLVARRKTAYGGSPPVKVALPPQGEVELRLPRGVRVEGRVVDAGTAEPVSGARVMATVPMDRAMGGRVMSSTGRPVASSESDDEGRFVLEEVPVGSITLSASHERYRDRSLEVDLEKRRDDEALTIPLERGLAIAGQVVAPSGAPAAGVTVTAVSASSSALARSPAAYPSPQRTDRDGRFRIEGLDPRGYELTASDQEGASAREVVEAGDEDVVLRLAAPGAVRGRVRGEDGSAVSAAEVLLRRARGSILASMTDDRTGHSDAGGGFEFRGLAPGDYALSVRAEGWAAASESATVRSGETAEVEVSLKAGGTVLGTVRGLSADELSRCTVSSVGTSTQPAADGSFRLTGVGRGRTAVMAMVRPELKVRRAAVEVTDPAVPVQVELDFSGGLSLSGTVSRAGHPVAGATVSAGAPRGFGASESTTGEDGAYAISGLSEGEVAVSVLSPQGQAVVSRRLTLTEDTRLDLELPEGVVHGRVMAAGTREPVGGATVSIDSADPAGLPRTARTDGAGAFTVREVADGTYRVRAQAPGYAGGEAQASVSMGVSPEVTVTLEEERALVLRLREPSGAVPDQAFVLPMRGGVVEDGVWAACDREGRVRVTALPPGQYVLLVSGEGAALVAASVPSPEQLVILAHTGTLAVLPPKGGSGSWRVRVASQAGLPVPVSPWQSPSRDGWMTVSGAPAGLRLPAGAYVVEAVAADGTVRSYPAVVPAGGRATVAME